MKSVSRFRRLSIRLVGAACVVSCAVVFLNANAQTAPEPGALVQIDAANVLPSYANFARVTGTLEEIILDFGLNATPAGPPPGPIKIDHRIAMNYYSAKRFLSALQQSVDRHEAAFGPIEVDVTKRVKRPYAP